ncbi:MAG: transposase [candidate division Zixibacteria bacterium]|nr:transposase [candidate division Zixibacteria bacterium]
MPKLRHYDHLGTARFVTVSCRHRRQLLTDPERIRILLEELDNSRRKHGLLIYGYVVMPEHFHLVCLPPDDLKLGAVIGEIKSKTARRIFKMIRESGSHIPQALNIVKDGLLRPAFWQPRCYDHNCRTTDTTLEKINYCHNNPVKRGLASTPEDWPWSSAAWYAGDRDVPFVIDTIGAEIEMVN